MLVRSPTSERILYAIRRVSPVLVKTMPNMSDPRMNQTEGSKKSVNATLAGRMRRIAWMTPIAMLVTPMGTTSLIHQAAAKRKRAMAAWPSGVRGNSRPWGSYRPGKAETASLGSADARVSPTKYKHETRATAVRLVRLR